MVNDIVAGVLAVLAFGAGIWGIWFEIGPERRRKEIDVNDSINEQVTKK